MPASPAEQMVTDWVRSYLSTRFSVNPSSIDLKQKLAGWGLASSEVLAGLAGDFNRFCHSQQDWRHVDIVPPDIIDAKPTTLAALIASIVKRIAAPPAAKANFISFTQEIRGDASANRPASSDVTNWLLTYLVSDWHATIPKDGRKKQELQSKDHLNDIGIKSAQYDTGYIINDFDRHYGAMPTNATAVSNCITNNETIAKLGAALAQAPKPRNP